MYIRSLKLFQIRNLIDSEVEFSPGMNLILGRNGQGKTNLVEAVHFLSCGRSFRTTKARDLISWEKREASLFGTVCSDQSEDELGVVLHLTNREYFINGDKVPTLADLVGKFICVTFSPTDLKLVRGAPTERRKFVDKHMVELYPPKMNHIVRYQRALKQKNTLLKEDRITEGEIEPWNNILAESGAEILQARVDFLDALFERANRIYQEFSKEDGNLTYKLDSNAIGEGGDISPDGIGDILWKNYEKERILKRSIIGPHRDDIEIDLSGHSGRAFASQGQARSIVLSLKQAVIDLIYEFRGKRAVVLLDDVDSELDQGRVEALMKTIELDKYQVFITGTNDKIQDRFPTSGSRIFMVDQGSVSG